MQKAVREIVVRIHHAVAKLATAILAVANLTIVVNPTTIASQIAASQAIAAQRNVVNS